jgi:hypothetical protein
MSERSTHSKLGVVSTILPLAVWLYLGFSFLLLSWKPSLRFVDRIFGNSTGALGVVIILAIILFGLIPITGHLAAIVCAITGLFSRDKKRIFAVVGLILTILPLAIGLLLYGAGYDFKF